MVTFILAFHVYFLKDAKEKKTKEIEFWKRGVENYAWLIHSIEKLIRRKISAYSTAIDNPKKFLKESVWKNLQMLYEFYQHYSNNPDLRLKIVIFTPSEDSRYLISLFWYNAENQQPRSHLNPDEQRVIFSKERSTTVAVQAWKSKRPEVAETEDEIHPNYHDQTRSIKSIIAYPVFGEDASEIIGIITISANKEKFFLRAEIPTHERFINQFGIRIAVEMARYKRFLETNNGGKEL